MFNYEMLTDKELLKMLVMEREDETITEDLLARFIKLSDILIDSDEVELLKIKGLGIKKVQQLKAASEIARRLYSKSPLEGYKISQPQDVADLLIPEMKFLKKEHLKVVLLNTKNVVISSETVSIGSLSSSIVHPRETFIHAIRKSAAAIILCHNHPSGDPSPSSEDKNITKRIADCGKLLGIELLDHIIIGGPTYISMKEEGFL